MRRSISALLAIGLLAIALCMTAVDEEAIAAPEDETLFEEKVVTVYLGDPMKGSGQVLEDASLKQVGGRWMLVGTSASTGHAGEWAAGVTTGVAWDSVTAFYVFTQDEFNKSSKAYRSK